MNYKHCSGEKSLLSGFRMVVVLGSQASTSRRGFSFVSSYDFLLYFFSVFFSSSGSNSEKAYIILKITTLQGWSNSGTFSIKDSMTPKINSEHNVCSMQPVFLLEIRLKKIIAASCTSESQQHRISETKGKISSVSLKIES